MGGSHSQTSAPGRSREQRAGTPPAGCGQEHKLLVDRAALEWIGSLPGDQAEAVLLRVVIRLDAASGGRVLAKRPGAVRTAAYRGLRRRQQPWTMTRRATKLDRRGRV